MVPCQHVTCSQHACRASRRLCCPGRYWAVQLSGLSVGSISVAVTATQAIVDSGSTAILLDPTDAMAVHQVRPPAAEPPTRRKRAGRAHAALVAGCHHDADQSPAAA